MKRDGERGSTLLEVLVAFVILAGAVVMSFRIFGDGITGLRKAQERSEMVAIARRELARLELSPALKAGSFAGKDDRGFVWSASLDLEDELPANREGVVPFRVKILVGMDRTPQQYPVSVETTLLAVPAR